jgi:hypothetical protein
VRRLRGIVGVSALDEDDVLFRHQLAEAPSDRLERIFGLGLSLRASEVRQQHDARATIEQRLDRSEARHECVYRR